MLIVSVDPDVVERQLDEGELVCPKCRVGVVRRHCWVDRFVRGGGGVGVEARVRLRRGVCTAKGCEGTHVLLPCSLLGRRLDEVVVIGRAVMWRLDGWSWGRIAAGVGCAVSTVRGWWQRLAGSAERLRAVFSVALHAMEFDAPAVLVPVGDAVAVMAETAGAVRRLAAGTVVRRAPVWQVVSVLTNGALLAPIPPEWILFHPHGSCNSSPHSGGAGVLM